MSELEIKIKQIEDQGVFLGGPRELFEEAGRKMLMLLLSEGLSPESKVLDLGCGCLRAGYWFIHFLKPQGYSGIEPNSTMLEAGLDSLFNRELLEYKTPRFDCNSDFDPSGFNDKFDYFLARSIWTHASKNQIIQMLQTFLKFANDEAVFLTSFLEAGNESEEYWGDVWVGKSHESNTAGIVKHSYTWVKNICGDLELQVERIRENTFDLENNQRWLKISKVT